MKKRLFLAINLPDKIKHLIDAEIAVIEKKMPEGIRFLTSGNWHITTTFLGYQEDLVMTNIIKAVGDSVPKIESPEIELESITYGPPGKTPRMIWLNGTGKTSKIIASIKQQTEEKLTAQNIRFDLENREYHCHITLARFEKNQVGELPPLNSKLTLEFKANTLDLMESHLKRSGAEYEKLLSVDFK